MAKTILALVFTLIVSASGPSPVFAAARPGSKPVPVTLGGFSLSPTINGYLFSGSEQRDPTQTYGLKVGYDKIGTSIADSLGIEGSVNYFSTTSKVDAGTASGYIFRLDATYPFLVGAKWMPFLAVGGGGIFIDTASHAEKSALLNYGAGLKYFFEDYLAVRMDVRQLIVYNNVNTRNNFEFGIGVSYYFGKESKKKPVPPPASKKEETKDARSGEKTLGTATRAASGIPALEEIATTAVGKADGEKRSALQGETESVSLPTSLVPLIALAPLLALESTAQLLFQAEAPKESIGEKYMMREVSPPRVKEAQAPAEERTPIQAAAPAVVPVPPSVATTPSPVITEERIPEPALTLPMAAENMQTSPAKTEEPVLSAVEKNVVRKLPVKFDFDSSYIKPKFHDELVELADIMKSSDSISARIEGHSDSIGDSKHNIMLSEKRVERVRNSLIKSGVNPDRISSVVYEPSRAIADNATTAGRQKNHPDVTLVTLTGDAKTVPSPVTAEAAAPLKSEPAPTPAEEKKTAPVTAPAVVPAPPSVATIPSPVIVTERKPEAAPSLPAATAAAAAQPAPAGGDKPARQAVGKKVVRKLSVEFGINSSYIKPKYFKKLGKIADIMKGSANASARIEGHADSTGKFSYNIKLSKQRAQSVRSSLIKLGVAPGRISTAGYGPSRPIADNATIEGRRRNRRAETFVTIIIYE